MKQVILVFLMIAVAQIAAQCFSTLEVTATNVNDLQLEYIADSTSCCSFNTFESVIRDVDGNIVVECAVGEQCAFRLTGTTFTVDSITPSAGCEVVNRSVRIYTSNTADCHGDCICTDTGTTSGFYLLREDTTEPETVSCCAGQCTSGVASDCGTVKTGNLDVTSCGWSTEFAAIPLDECSPACSNPFPFPVNLFGGFFSGDVNVVGPTGTDIEGRLGVGGDLNWRNSIGSHIAGPNTNTFNCTALTICYTYALVVAGSANLTGGVYGGESWASSFENNGVTFQCLAHSDPPQPIDFPAVFAQLETLSCRLNQRTRTGSVGWFQVGNLGFQGTQVNTIETFYTTTASLQQATRLSFTKINAGVQAIIINVAGTSFTTNSQGVNMWELQPFANRILWNFFEATSLVLNNVGWMGTILAPNAIITGNNTNIVGQVIAAGYEAHIQLNENLFAGCLSVDFNTPCA